MLGTVKRYIEARGFGFIRPDGTESSREEVFIHIKSVLEGDITQGVRVKFDVGEDPQGRPRAEKVFVLKPTDDGYFDGGNA